MEMMDKTGDFMHKLSQMQSGESSHNSTWEALDRWLDKLEEFKKENPVLFRRKFKERFGIDLNLMDGGMPRKHDPDWYMLPWKELDRMGKLEQLKAEYPGLFRQKYRYEFGTDYPDHKM